MDRYTRKDAEAAFALLCKRLDKDCSGPVWSRVGDRNVAKVGTWFLDHNAVYGGYVVAEIVSEGGGESHPLGDVRRNAREFCSHVHFALRVLSEQSATTYSVAEVRNGTGFRPAARFREVAL